VGAYCRGAHCLQGSDGLMRFVSTHARLTLGALLALVLAAAAPSPPDAHAFVIAGKRWPGHRVTYRLELRRFAWAVRAAAEQWNHSGADVRFVEVHRGHADVVVTALRHAPCLGRVGDAPVGHPFAGFVAHVHMQASCPPQQALIVAAHELGHVLGLGHELRACATMNPVVGLLCGRHPLPWEYYCRAVSKDDARGAVRLYGGHLRRLAPHLLCVEKTVPHSVRLARAIANPPYSFASTEITWRNPLDATLAHVVVSRDDGHGCPNVPAVFGRSIDIRPGITPDTGTQIAELDVSAARGRSQSVVDIAPVSPGRHCYTIWALSAHDQYRGATRIVMNHRGGPSAIGPRIGLEVSTAGLPAGARARLSWTTPSDVPLKTVAVVRAPGVCPQDPAAFRGSTLGTVSPAPGAATFDDATRPPAGTWCYGVEFYPSTVPPGLAAAPLALAQVALT